MPADVDKALRRKTLEVAIDTNRYVDFARGLPEAVERFRRADEIFVPFVVLGELRAGFAGGDRPGENEANLVRWGVPGAPHAPICCLGTPRQSRGVPRNYADTLLA